MVNLELSEDLLRHLLLLEKQRVNDQCYNYPSEGSKLSIPLESTDGKESFHLDISRARIRLSKYKYQERYARVIPLIRVDIDAAPHTNPDGSVIQGNHIHIYKKGHGDKWAYELPSEEFADANDMKKTLLDFFRYCNIVKPPRINWELGVF